LPTSVGAITGALVNSMLNHRSAFDSQRPYADALARYGAVSIGAIALSVLVLTVLTSTPALNYLGAQVLATLVVFVAAFALNRAWTF
jgi:putative flippase GtrA